MTTTSSSESNARSSSTTPATAWSSFRAGTTAMRRLGTRTCRDAEADEREQLPGPVRVGVLVEDALARAGAHRLRLRRVVEQAAIGGERLVGIVDDEELLARLEPALDPLVGVRDDRRAGARELERPAGRRRLDGGVGAAGDVEVDPRCRDRVVEGVERDVADEPRPAGVPLEVAAAERELELRGGPARLPHHRGHPLAPELVPVAVEEDVVQLLDRPRREELRVGAPEDGLGAPGAELEQARQAALGARDDEVVLGR